MSFNTNNKISNIKDKYSIDKIRSKRPRKKQNSLNVLKDLSFELYCKSQLKKILISIIRKSKFIDKLINQILYKSD